MNKDTEKDLGENAGSNDSYDHNKIFNPESEKKQTTDNIKYGRATFGRIFKTELYNSVARAIKNSCYYFY